MASLAHWYGGLVAFIFAAFIVIGGIGERPQRTWLRRSAGVLLGVVLGALAAGTGLIHRADDNIVEIKSAEMVRFTTIPGSAIPDLHLARRAPVPRLPKDVGQQRAVPACPLPRRGRFGLGIWGGRDVADTRASCSGEERHA